MNRQLGRVPEVLCSWGEWEQYVGAYFAASHLCGLRGSCVLTAVVLNWKLSKTVAKAR